MKITKEHVIKYSKLQSIEKIITTAMNLEKLVIYKHLNGEEIGDGAFEILDYYYSVIKKIIVDGEQIK